MNATRRAKIEYFQLVKTPLVHHWCTPNIVYRCIILFTVRCRCARRQHPNRLTLTKIAEESAAVYSENVMIRMLSVQSIFNNSVKVWVENAGISKFAYLIQCIYAYLYLDSFSMLCICRSIHINTICLVSYNCTLFIHTQWEGIALQKKYKWTVHLTIHYLNTLSMLSVISSQHPQTRLRFVWLCDGALFTCINITEHSLQI